MKEMPELVPFNQVFSCSFAYNTFKEGNFYTKCVFHNVEADKKPVVLIYSNFQALMNHYNIKMKTYKGLIFTTNELEDIAAGDKHGEIMKILKLELKCITVEDEKAFHRAKILSGAETALLTCGELETIKRKNIEENYGTGKSTKKQKE